MRRLLVIFGVLALVVPATSVASKRDPSDGTLSLRGGHGTFTVNARGGVIGSFLHGKVIITDPIDGDGTGPIVSGDDWQKDRGDGKTTVYGGTKVRFRMIGGTFKIRVIGSGVNLSVVGRGQVTLNGAGSGDDGSYSVNGSSYADVPDLSQFTLSAASP
ncbi:MAG: hypothetical protein E6G60_04675 [Actinobacteria bacterium]|nr:MAG: hypothetical protein E6G60_04675 [Actinomycetota bacterium]